MKCPDCNSEMILKTTTKFIYKNGNPRKFYGCSNYPKCKATHGAHPDGSPLGHPADRETKDARIRLHTAIDPLFPSKREMYQWLKANAPKEHIGDMTLAEIEKIEHLLERL